MAATEYETHCHMRVHVPASPPIRQLLRKPDKLQLLPEERAPITRKVGAKAAGVVAVAGVAQMGSLASSLAEAMAARVLPVPISSLLGSTHPALMSSMRLAELLVLRLARQVGSLVCFRSATSRRGHMVDVRAHNVTRTRRAHTGVDPMAIPMLVAAHVVVKCRSTDVETACYAVPTQVAQMAAAAEAERAAQEGSEHPEAPPGVQRVIP